LRSPPHRTSAEQHREENRRHQPPEKDDTLKLFRMRFLMDFIKAEAVHFETARREKF